MFCKRRFSRYAPRLKYVNAILLFLLVLHVPKLFDQVAEWCEYASLSTHQPSTGESPELRWSGVDIKSPPRLNDTMLEIMRMNEFLAHPTYKCTKTKVGAEKAEFSICDGYDRAEAKFLYISGATKAKPGFAKGINVTRWVVFVSEGSSILRQIEGNYDIEVNHLELNARRRIQVDNIAGAVKRQEFSLAEIDFYSPSLGEDQLGQAPHLVGRLLPVRYIFNLGQLLLLVKVERSSAKSVLPKWHRLFYRMFFRHNYYLVASESNLACGVDLEYFGHCEHRITFFHAEGIHHQSVDVPVFGLGSPMEEKFRLVKYLSSSGFGKNLMNCTTRPSEDQLPQPCARKQNKSSCSTMIYFRYRPITTQGQMNHIAEVYSSMCRLFLFYPVPTKIRVPRRLVKLMAVGISTNLANNTVIPGATINSEWQLEPFVELMRRIELKTYENNILALDLDGGEWSVLSALTDQSVCPTLRSFHQLLFRVHLWAIEEANNYRRFYLWFLRLEACGFKLASSEQHSPNAFHLVYARKALVY